ncbi:hypothetical protein DET57_10785 [Klebsiella oxytoca]|uniref:Uncharacterized protein n=1 Tax=Klebsiella oxytoca TaxID=571 RepID=A0A318FT83_KLEOX|nr:hypothetical protein [Klebsiella oxytoca]PXW45292.1 hypothetical protein DET57_10785 [Klebsiella oxytoca]HCB1499206.1 hypothetical protein [Klebsiella michiganensis]HCB1845617.1 hypothetical protein [Klebsiella oxytoca]
MSNNFIVEFCEGVSPSPAAPSILQVLLVNFPTIVRVPLLACIVEESNISDIPMLNDTLQFLFMIALYYMFGAGLSDKEDKPGNVVLMINNN